MTVPARVIRGLSIEFVQSRVTNLAFNRSGLQDPEESGQDSSLRSE